MDDMQIFHGDMVIPALCRCIGLGDYYTIGGVLSAASIEKVLSLKVQKGGNSAVIRGDRTPCTVPSFNDIGGAFTVNKMYFHVPVNESSHCME